MSLRDRKKKGTADKVLDVDASMQGTLKFRDPVNLRINGNFEGSLDTKGLLTIGEGAVVAATIVGEDIVISGAVTGNITARNKLALTASAVVSGDISTPVLSIEEGAKFHGKCQMGLKAGNRSSNKDDWLTSEEVARYLEVDAASVLEWADNGKIPALRDGDDWKFERMKVDKWVAEEKVR